HVVERDLRRLGADQRRRNGGLQEHVVDGTVARDLRDEAERDPAARPRALRVAGQLASDLVDVGGEVAALGGDALVEAVGLQSRESRRVVGLLGHRLMNLSRSSGHSNDVMNSTYCTFSL